MNVLHVDDGFFFRSFMQDLNFMAYYSKASLCKQFHHLCKTQNKTLLRTIHLKMA